MRLLKTTAFFLLCSGILTFCAFSVDEAQIAQEITFNAKSLEDYANVEGAPSITGKNAYVINLDSGTVIYEKNSAVKAYPASTVKLLTALVAYENIENLDVPVIISKEIVRQAAGANMALKIDEVITARNLLNGVLITGANDAALALAELVSGSEEEFCALMNDKAKELGALDSSFDNVTGFHSPGTYSTARDMAIIARAVYYTDELFEISDTTRHTVEPTNKTNTIRTLLNRNTLISRVRGQNDYYQGSHGMSLGSTPEGGQCIVSTYTTSENLTYLCVVLGSEETQDKNLACSDAANLFDFCKNNFSMQTVTSTNDVACEIDVLLASDTDYVTLFPAEDIEVLLPSKLDFVNDIILERRVYSDSAKAPIHKGGEYGEIVVRYKNDVVVGKTKLIAGASVDRSNLLYFFSRVQGFLTGLWFRVFAIAAVVLYGLYSVLYLYYNSKSRCKKGKRR